MFIIYQVTNKVNGKSYIGFTTQSLEKRWRTHRSSSKRPLVHFHHAIHKYGALAFSFKILEMGENEVYGKNVAERMYIAWLKPEYNKTDGGDGKLGYRWSLEGREKQRQNSIAYFKTPGALESHRVRQLRPEVNAARIKALTGQIHGPHKKYERTRITCFHCGKIGARSNMKRYHFDNCKSRIES